MAMNRFYDDKLGGLKKPSHRRWEFFLNLFALIIFFVEHQLLWIDCIFESMYEIKWTSQ